MLPQLDNDASDGIQLSSYPNGTRLKDASQDEQRVEEVGAGAAPWKALFYFTTTRNVPVLIAGVLFSTIAGAAGPAQAFVIGKVFSGLNDHAAGKSTGREFAAEQRDCVLYLFAIALGSWTVTFLDLSIWLAFGELQAKSARDRLFKGLLKREQAWYDMRKNGIGALLPRVQAQIRELQLATSQPLSMFVTLSASAVLSLAQALYRSWDLTLVTLASTPVVLALVILSGRPIQANLERQQDKLTEAQKFAAGAFTAIETVKCYNGQELEHDKYTKRVFEARTFSNRIANAAAWQMALIAFLSLSMFVQGFYYGETLIASGENDASDVVTTFLSAIAAFQAINGILPQLTVMEKGRTAGFILRKIMAQLAFSPGEPQNVDSLMPPSCEGSISFRRVSFHYPSRPDPPALIDVTLNVAPGELRFLIGKSGSGKSTIGQLLVRFYDASQGSVMLDGIDVRSLDVNWLRSNVTLVEQNTLLFNDSVYRNIALGRGSIANVTREKAMAAAEFALLQHMIDDMPDGLDSCLDNNGASMSGGQRQRMALARARLRDTPILILDESTSALDHVSRALMMEAIRHWRNGRTTIIITHDISQIQPDDFVSILENGRLVQEGYRKHLEEQHQSAFHGFLTGDIGERKDSYHVRQLEVSERDRRRTMRPSHWHKDMFQSVRRQDPLEAQLAGAEIHNALLIPAVFEEGAPFSSVRGARASRARLSTFSPPLRTIGASFTPELPPAASISERRFARLGTEDLAPVTKSPYLARERRESKVMQNILTSRGHVAADSRSRHRGVQRLQVATPKGDSSASPCSVMDNGSDLVGQQSLKSILSTLWPRLTGQSKLALIMGLFAATLHAISTPVFAYVLSQLLKSYSIEGGDAAAALKWSMVIIVIAVIDGLATYLFLYCSEYAAQEWVDSIRADAMRRILDQPREFFDKNENSPSQLTGSLDRDAEEMRNIVGRFVVLVWIAALMTSVSIVWAMVAQWKLTMISLAVAPYIWAVTRLFTSISDNWETRSNEAADKVASIFTETFANVKTVRALTLEDHFLKKYISSTKRAFQIGFRRSFFTGFFFGMSDSAGNLSLCWMFYVGARLVRAGVDVQDVIQVFTMLLFAITNLGAIMNYIPQMGASKDAASRILRLAQLPDDSHEHVGHKQITSFTGIRFDDLTFAYPSRAEQSVLKHFSLAVTPGTCTAIVGGSGSGKSTIASLLLKIHATATLPGGGYQRPGPDVALSGLDLKQISTSSLRALIVPVPQCPTLFSASVTENIAYGLPADSPLCTKQAVAAAASQAGVHDFISSLPQGYDTALGEGGMGVSGGQAQRIAIARALIRRPAVLLLDEATSALDVKSSNLIRQTIQSLVHDRCRPLTVIIITHSRSMMEIADRVVVLNQGKVVEEGGFHHLLKSGGALTNLLSGGD